MHVDIVVGVCDEESGIDEIAFIVMVVAFGIEIALSWCVQRIEGHYGAVVFINFLEAHSPFHQLPDEYRNMYTDKPLSELRAYGQMAFGVLGPAVVQGATADDGDLV